MRLTSHVRFGERRLETQVMLCAGRRLYSIKQETAVSEADVRTAHSRFVQGESIKELAQELGIPWQTLRAQFRQYGLSAGRVETAVVPIQKAVETDVSPPTSNQANPVAVADGMDHIISLGRLVRDLQAAGVAVKVSGRVVVELEF